MTEEEKAILINEIVDYLISNSQSVEGIPIIESLDGVSSFPAIKDHINEESDVVRISINSILPEFRFINGRIQYKFTDREWIDLFTVSSAMSNYATNDYVILKIGEVIDDAPATMNTLNKIAAALNYDYDFYKNIYQAINSKWTKNDVKIANWDASYSWGDHRLAGYEKSLGAPLYKQSLLSSSNNGSRSWLDCIKSNEIVEYNDQSIMTSLKVINEIANNNLFINENYLNSKNESVANEFLIFLKGIKLGLYSDNNNSGGIIKVQPDGSSYIEVDRIKARLKSELYNVNLNKTTYIAGTEIITKCGFVCTKVEEFDTFYRCYILSDDGEKYTSHGFEVGDQAISQEFNIKSSSHNSSNQFYWRLVIGIGVNYIDLDKSDCAEGSGVPLKNDYIIQLGNRESVNRQDAIIISIIGEDAPSFKQYKNINSFSLEGKDSVSISLHGNKINAELYTERGDKVSTVIDLINERITDEINSVRNDIAKSSSILNNPNFNLMNYWVTDNDVTPYRAKNKWIYVNNHLYSYKSKYAGSSFIENKNTLFIKDRYVIQKDGSFNAIPEFAKNAESLYIPEYFYIKFYYKVKKDGVLDIKFENENKNGWVYYDSITIQKELTLDDSYKTFEDSIVWNGTGDFKLSFTGEINIYGVILAKDRISQVEHDLKNYLTKDDGIEVWNIAELNLENGSQFKVSNILNESNGKVQIDNNYIDITGTSTKDDNVLFLEDGSIEIKNGSISGMISYKWRLMPSPEGGYDQLVNLLEGSHIILQGQNDQYNIVLPNSTENVGACLKIMGGNPGLSTSDQFPAIKTNGNDVFVSETNDLINNKKNITINTPNKIYTFYSFDGMWYVENEDGLTFS